MADSAAAAWLEDAGDAVALLPLLLLSADAAAAACARGGGEEEEEEEEGGGALDLSSPGISGSSSESPPESAVLL